MVTLKENIFSLFLATIFIAGSCCFSLAQTARVNGPDTAAALQSDTANNRTAAQADSTPDSIPRLAKFVKADYPPAALARGIEGSVVLDLLVSDSGTVDSVAVVSAADSSLGPAAAAAAKKFRFSPARFGGKPEAVVMQYEYRFSLDEAVDTTSPVVNFQGSLLEYGTRRKIPNALIRITPLDTGLIVSNLPLRRYLKRLCGIEKYSLDSLSVMIESDSTGAFTCAGLPPCTCLVRVIAPGYEAFTRHAVILKGQVTEATWYIRPEGFGGQNEIVVYGKAQESQVSHRELKPAEIRRVPGFSGDAIRVIQAMPGVARTSYGGGELQVRGAGPYDNKFFIDGIEVPYVYHSISTMAITESVYNGFLLSAVDFYPGGFDARYGGAIGGVVDVKPREPRLDGYHGSIEQSLLKSSVALEARLSPKVAVAASFRRTYFDLFKPLMENFIPGITTVPYYQDYVARIDFTPRKSHHLFFSMIGADDGVEVVDNEARGGDSAVDSAVNTFKFNTGFKLYTFGADYKAGKWSNELRLGIRPMNGVISAYGRFKYSMDNGMVYTLRNTASVEVNDRLKMYGGLDLTRKEVTGTIRFVDTVAQTSSAKMKINLGGPFCGLDWKVMNKLTLSPSLRLDFHSPLAVPGTALPEFWDYSFDNGTRVKAAPALRIKAAYDLSPRHAFQAMTGTYSALPHVTEYSMAASFFGDDAAVYEALNPISGKKDAKLIHGQQNVLGYKWTPFPLFSAEVQAYYNRQWDVTRYMYWQEYREGPQDNVWLRDNGKARMKGLEILLRRNQGKRFFGWISYTLSQCEEYDPWMRTWSKRNWDATNYLQMIGSWKITPIVEVGLRGRYSDGFWYTPVVGRDFYDEDWSYYRLGRGKEKSKRMDPYINLDLRLEAKVPLQWGTVSAYIEGVNLVNSLAYIKKSNGKPIYRMPEGNWFEYNYYGDEKAFETFIPLANMGLTLEF
jgi:TonB family protein